MKFEHLIKAVNIGLLAIRTRIVFPAISNCYCSSDGYVTDETLGYYEERAKGGAGLVILEATCVESRLGPLGVGRGPVFAAPSGRDEHHAGYQEL